MFTLGRNMISLITNETCFAMKSVHIRRCIARLMIETCLFWSWSKLPREVVSIMIRLNTLKMADYAGEGECPKDPNLGLLCEQMLSWNGTMKRYSSNKQRCVESRIFKRTLPQNNDTSLIQAHCIAMQNQNFQPRTKVYKWKAKNIRNTSGQGRNTCLLLRNEKKNFMWWSLGDKQQARTGVACTKHAGIQCDASFMRVLCTERHTLNQTRNVFETDTLCEQCNNKHV